MAENRLRFRADLEDKVSGKLAKIRDNFDRMGKSKGFKALAQGVGLGIGAAAFNLIGSASSAAADFIGDSVNAARDMSETLSKSKVVFGSAAANIERFGDTAAKSLFISKRAAIEAAATFGNFFVGLGKGEGEAASMSKRMVSLAADLASFNNLDPTEVLDKLRAGLAGEAEPLRRVGVFLNEAKVKAKAMELGLADANGEISDGAKVTARYNIILDETTTAQGDAARTADGLANKQRRLNAEIADAQAKFGDQLQPAVLSATNAGLGLLTNLQGLADVLGGKSTPAAVEFGIAIGRVPPSMASAARHAAGLEDNLLQTTSAMANNKDAANKLTPAMQRAADATDKFEKEAKTAKERADELGDSMKSAAQKIIEDYYRPIEIRQEMEANKAELTAARKILASKSSSAAEIRDAKRVVTQAIKSNDELALELLSTGEMTTAQTKKYFRDLDTRIKKATGDGKRYLIDLRREALKINNLKLYLNFVARIRSTGVGAAVHEGGLQHGGPARAGHAYTVGEAGPETLVMGNQSGYVIPNGGMGGTQVIQLVVDGQVLAEIVDKRLSYAAGRAPQSRHLS